MVFGRIDFLHKLGNNAPTFLFGTDAHVCVAKNNHERDKYYNHDACAKNKPRSTCERVNIIHPNTYKSVLVNYSTLHVSAEENNNRMMHVSVINYNHPYGKIEQDSNSTTGETHKSAELLPHPHRMAILGTESRQLSTGERVGKKTRTEKRGYGSR